MIKYICEQKRNINSLGDFDNEEERGEKRWRINFFQIARLTKNPK